VTSPDDTNLSLLSESSVEIQRLGGNVSDGVLAVPSLRGTFSSGIPSGEYFLRMGDCDVALEHWQLSPRSGGI